MNQHPYAGMRITADGITLQELLASGRYDKARRDRQNVCRGRCEIDGTRISDRDDTGFTADGVFIGDDGLHHAGMVVYRRR